MGRGTQWLISLGFYDRPSPVHVDGNNWLLSISQWGLFPIAEMVPAS